MIVFFKRVGEDPEQLEPDEMPRYFARASWVFNVAQIDGWEPPQSFRPCSVDVIDEVDAFVGATSAEIVHGFRTACYRPSKDRIEMPDPEWFTGTSTRTATEGYYSVLLHELTHWTGAPRRLNREFGKRFGDEAYAFEELVAELGAAFLCAALGITNAPRADHARYLASWLKLLKQDTRAIFTAASRAQDALEYLGALASTGLDGSSQCDSGRAFQSAERGT